MATEDITLTAKFVSATIEQIKIATLPKTAYTLGETFSIDGIKINGVYNDSEKTEEELTSEQLATVKYYSDESCENELTPSSSTLDDTSINKIYVKYGELKTSYEISINEQKCVIHFTTEVGTFSNGQTSIFYDNLIKGKTLKEQGKTLPKITYSGTEYRQKNFLNASTVFTDDSPINDNIAVKANWILWEKTWDETSWDDLSNYADDYYSSIKSGASVETAQETLLSHFKYITSMEDFIGNTKTINYDGIEQNVRIVGTAADASYSSL